MELHAMGISYRHGREFKVSRPGGSGDNLLLIFKSHARINIGGNEISVPENHAVVYSKGYPQIYSADGGEYVNHWVHFGCSETDIFFDRIGLSFNDPRPVSDISAAENVLDMLSVESVSDSRNSAECTDLLLRLLLTKSLGSDGDAALSVHSSGLRRIRAEIYGSPSGSFTVSGLAAELSLSPSHFQALYKAEFGVSCYEDVLRAKTSAAEYYLRSTSLSVREIAALCGFENDVHFIRQFKKRTGMTAAEFRKFEHRN